MLEIMGKKALVFGGSSGIGLAAAKMLQAKGAHVTIISRDPDKPGTEGLHKERCDVVDTEAVASLCTRLAPFDIIIGTATGGARARGPFLDMQVSGFQGAFAKLWGYVNILHEGIPHLSAGGCAVLVSGSPARRSEPGMVAIASVGGAVEALVRAVAPEITPKRLNVVAPGFIDTPMFDAVGDERANVIKARTDHHLIPRAGTADEVAQAIIFQVENEFVTGTTIDVDGGWLLAR